MPDWTGCGAKLCLLSGSIRKPRYRGDDPYGDRNASLNPLPKHREGDPRLGRSTKERAPQAPAMEQRLPATRSDAAVARPPLIRRKATPVLSRVEHEPTAVLDQPGQVVAHLPPDGQFILPAGRNGVQNDLGGGLQQPLLGLGRNLEGIVVVGNRRGRRHGGRTVPGPRESVGRTVPWPPA